MRNRWKKNSEDTETIQGAEKNILKNNTIGVTENLIHEIRTVSYKKEHFI